MNVLVSGLAVAGHFALLFFAIAAAAAYGGVLEGLVLISCIVFTVVNARILCPWPRQRYDMRGSFLFARLSLWVALLLSLLFSAAGVSGIDPFGEWLAAFLILGMTSSLNLLALRLLPI